MQDKEILDEAEETLTSKVEETSSTCSDQKDAVEEKREINETQIKKEQTKENKKNLFRKTKQPKRDKNSSSRFEGEGVSFKAKIIGIESVNDARGDKMCQEAMQRLKVNVRNTGPHKRKIVIYVSLQGIKIKDEKTGDIIYHHPVPLISFISQDVSDARAFGYVFGSSNGKHQFIAIKTEKPAFHVVVALRDLFQTVLNWKQEKIEKAIEAKAESKASSSKIEPEDACEVIEKELEVICPKEHAAPVENICFAVVLAPELNDPSVAIDFVTDTKDTVKTVDDLLGLQNELNKLQQGIDQMDTSIAEATFNLGIIVPEKDPFDTSFVNGSKMDPLHPMPVPVPVASTPISGENTHAIMPTENITNGDKYAAFSEFTSGPSIFENSSASQNNQSMYDASEIIASGIDAQISVPEISELEEEIALKSISPPAKPPRKLQTSDINVFADLDPLGRDRPYKDKAEFFQDVKNPPKKVLNDLVDKSSSSGDESVSRAFDINLGAAPVVFSQGLDTLCSPTPPPFLPPRISGLSSSLPNSFANHLKLSVAIPQNGCTHNPYNPFENVDQTDLQMHLPAYTKLKTRASEPLFQVLNSPQNKSTQNNTLNDLTYLGKTPPSNGILSIAQPHFAIGWPSSNSDSPEDVQSQYTSSSPIPIPARQSISHSNDRSLSNGSNGSSLYSKSPLSFVAESPTHVDYFSQNFTDTEGSSPGSLVGKNGVTVMNGKNLQKNLSKENLSEISVNSSALIGNGVDRNLYGISSSSSKTSPNSATQNGMSRPRPRPLINKTIPVQSNGSMVKPSLHLSSVPSCDNEAISRENMQSIANVLLSNGHRTRKNSLPIHSHRDYEISFSREKTIFAKENDPFADDFFCSLPKKVNGHITTEIQDLA